MAIEQGLYAQAFNIRQKYFKFTAATKNKNEAKFKSQGQSTRSKRWFDPEFDLIEVNFSAHKPGFNKILFQIHENTQDTIAFKIFQVSIGNS